MSTSKLVQNSWVIMALAFTAFFSISMITTTEGEKSATEDLVTIGWNDQCGLGEIKMFAGNFAPRNWAFCDGQLLPIAQNTALFSILGTIYGGDGRSTFGLPDMRSRLPMHAGTGSGLSNRVLGGKLGQEETTITALNMPMHNHTSTVTGDVFLSCGTGPADTNDPHGSYFAHNDDKRFSSTSGGPLVKGLSTNLTATVGNAGGGQPFYHMPPIQVVNFIICLQGDFPSRS